MCCKSCKWSKVKLFDHVSKPSDKTRENTQVIIWQVVLQSCTETTKTSWIFKIIFFSDVAISKKLGWTGCGAIQLSYARLIPNMVYLVLLFKQAIFPKLLHTIKFFSKNILCLHIKNFANAYSEVCMNYEF